MNAEDLLLLTVTLAAIGGLALLDPKRNRSRRDRTAVQLGRVVALLLAVIPGVVLLSQARIASFVVWFGFVAVAGWLAANLLRRQSVD